MATKAPITPRIPAEIHHAAMRHGLVAECYPEVIAGHGPTGRIAWALSSPQRPAGSDWTDLVRIASGTVRGDFPPHAWAAMRDALDTLKPTPQQSRIPGVINAQAIATGNVEPFPAELSIEHDLATDAYYVAVHDITEDTERGIWLTPAAMRQLIDAAQTALT